jgi:hypothetical protein
MVLIFSFEADLKLKDQFSGWDSDLAEENPTA